MNARADHARRNWRHVMSGSTAGAGSTLKTVMITALAAVAGFAAIYVTLGGRDNGRPPATAATPASASAKLNTGEMAAFVFKKEPVALAEVGFVDGQGKQRTLADWKGRVVLLNLWATWCAPCRKEMPALAKLQRELGSPKFEVVALAVDRAGADAAKKFLDSIDAKDLALYVDSTARGATALQAAGMPTTLLIDARGREIGRLTGAAEWDGEDAKRLVRAHLQ